MKKIISLVALFVGAVFCSAARSLAAGPSREAVPIGALHALTGWAAPAGQGELNAIRMAVDEINQSGGVAGRPLTLIAEDFCSDFGRIAPALTKLVAINKVPVILGPNWTEFSEVMAPLAERAKVVMISSSGYTPTLTANREHVFTLFPREDFFVQPLVHYIAGQKHQNLASVVSENSYFIGMFYAIEPQLKSSAVPIKRNHAVTPEQYDFRTLISRMKAEKVDAVLLLLSENGQNASFIKQARELGLLASLYGSNAIAYDTVLQSNRALANDVVYFDFVLNSSEVFRRKYRARYGQEPYFSSPKAYDSVYLIKAAMEKCGFLSEDIRGCLQTITHKGVSGTVSFDSTRNLAQPEPISDVFRVVDGKAARIGAVQQ